MWQPRALQTPFPSRWRPWDFPDPLPSRGPSHAIQLACRPARKPFCYGPFDTHVPLRALSLRCGSHVPCRRLSHPGGGHVTSQTPSSSSWWRCHIQNPTHEKNARFISVPVYTFPAFPPERVLGFNSRRRAFSKYKISLFRSWVAMAGSSGCRMLWVSQLVGGGNTYVEH